MEEIIKFVPKIKESEKDVLSESDLKSLYLGILRLVERNAIKTLEKKFKEEKQKLLEKIQQKDEQISSLKKLLNR